MKCRFPTKTTAASNEDWNLSTNALSTAVAVKWFAEWSAACAVACTKGERDAWMTGWIGLRLAMDGAWSRQGGLAS